MSDTDFGYGYGHGFGYGLGYGDGHGYGSGSGYGSVYGYGYSYGYGYGYGYGHGTIIATIADHGVRYHPPFTVVTVGCETHTIEHWRNNWREIAEKHSADVSEKDVEKILREVSCE